MDIRVESRFLEDGDGGSQSILGTDPELREALMMRMMSEEIAGL